jgi:hypothetical protein
MQRRTLWIVVVAGGMLLAAGGVAGSVAMGRLFRAMARPAWTLLQQAAAETRTDAGAAAFYDRHPGLGDRYPSAPVFVAASQGWRPKLARLPRQMPGAWEVIRGGGELNVNQSNDRLELTLRHWNGVSVLVATRDGALIDLIVE